MKLKKLELNLKPNVEQSLLKRIKILDYEISDIISDLINKHLTPYIDNADDRYSIKTKFGLLYTSFIPVYTTGKILNYTRNEFLNKYLDDVDYIEMFNEYEKNNFKNAYKPIFKMKGRNLNDIELTLSDTKYRGMQTRNTIKYYLDNKYICTFWSVEEASKHLNITPASVSYRLNSDNPEHTYYFMSV